MNGIMAWGKRGFPLFTNQWSLTPLILFAHYFSLGVILIGKEGD